jgi:DNA-binding response OmpR family regulator
LVVDDEHDVRRFLTMLFEDNGYDTMVAEDGKIALELIARRRPDLITLDVAMPEKSGVGVYRELKENEATKTIPVILVTGVAGEFEQFISSRRQVPPPDGYVPKPVDADVLLATVTRLLSR